MYGTYTEKIDYKEFVSQGKYKSHVWKNMA